MFIGKVPDRKDAAGPQVGEVVTLPCKVEQVGEVLGALRARLRGFRISAKTAGGIALAKIDALAELCRKAKYGVVVWAPPTLDVPHAELPSSRSPGSSKDLNPTQRFAGLSLGGNEGAMTAGARLDLAAAAFRSALPMRAARREYDPYRNSILPHAHGGRGGSARVDRLDFARPFAA